MVDFGKVGLPYRGTDSPQSFLYLAIKFLQKNMREEIPSNLSVSLGIPGSVSIFAMDNNFNP